MSALTVASDVILWFGVGLTVLLCVGVAVVRELLDRLHVVAAVTSVAVPLVVLSQAINAGAWRPGLKIVLIACLLIVTGPVATVATARARSTERRREGSGP